MKRMNLNYDEAVPRLQDSDVLLFRGSSWYSKWIKWAGDGQYSHAAMVSFHKNEPECIEFREGKGGRTVGLEHQVKQNNGEIDVYRINII